MLSINLNEELIKPFVKLWGVLHNKYGVLFIISLECRGITSVQIYIFFNDIQQNDSFISSLSCTQICGLPIYLETNHSPRS